MQKKIILLMLLIGIFIVGILIYIFLNYPAKIMSETEKEAAIANILGRKPNLTDDTRTGDLVFKGKYITFTYPAAANPRKQLLNGKEVPYTGLEQFIFKIENPKLTLSMEVINAPTNVASLNDFPSVRLRQIQTNTYTEKDVFIENVKGLSFEKQTTSGFEKTTFFLSNNKIYSFSIQSPDPKAVEELFNKIISSAKFL